MNEFNFWKENNINKHFTLNEKELKAEYEEYLDKVRRVDLNYQSDELTILGFMGSENGLNSVHKGSEFESIVKLLKPIRDQFMKDNPIS